MQWQNSGGNKVSIKCESVVMEGNRAGHRCKVTASDWRYVEGEEYQLCTVHAMAANTRGSLGFSEDQEKAFCERILKEQGTR